MSISMVTADLRAVDVADDERDDGVGTPPKNLTKLPNDVILTILLHLPSIRDRLNFGSVNHRLYYFVGQNSNRLGAWSHLLKEKGTYMLHSTDDMRSALGNMINGKTSVRLEYHNAKFSNHCCDQLALQDVRRLSLEVSGGNVGLSAILPKLPRLTYLCITVNHSGERTITKDDADALAKCPITELYLGRIILPANSVLPTTLTTLWFDIDTDLSLDRFVSALKSFTVLQSLTVSHAQFGGDGLFADFCENIMKMPTLKNITFNGCRLPTVVNVASRRSLAPIQYIELSSSSPDYDFNTALNTVLMLTMMPMVDVKISAEPNMIGLPMTLAAISNKRIRSLDFTLFAMDKNEENKKLEFRLAPAIICEKLSNLSLIHAFNKTVFPSFFGHCIGGQKMKMLTTCEFARCSALTDAMMETLVVSAAKLEMVDIIGCKNVTTATFDYLVRSFDSQTSDRLTVVMRGWLAKPSPSTAEWYMNTVAQGTVIPDHVHHNCVIKLASIKSWETDREFSRCEFTYKTAVRETKKNPKHELVIQDYEKGRYNEIVYHCSYGESVEVDEEKK